LDTDKYHTTIHIKEDTNNIKLTDDFEIHFLELPKIKDNDTNDSLSKWLLFLKGVSDETMEVISMAEPAIKKAVTVLDILSKEKEARELYELREKALHDEASNLVGAREEGKKEGKIEGKIEGERIKAVEIAKKALLSGSAVSFVATITSLNEDEVIKIKEELNN
jgi:predicted transposase/invertase (TIGR01784 family)